MDLTSTASPLLDALAAKCSGDYDGCYNAHEVKAVVQTWVYIVIVVVVLGVGIGIVISVCCFCKSCPLYKSLHKSPTPVPAAPRILTPVYVTQGNQYGARIYQQGPLPHHQQQQPYAYYAEMPPPPPYNAQGPRPAVS